MKARGLIIALLICSMVYLVGCTTMDSKDKVTSDPNLLEPQAVLKFSDIPLPNGFKQIQDSYSFESSGVRVGVLKYRGKSNPDQVVNFYKEQMAMYNWNLLNVVEYGQRLMNFDRENETCVITVMPKGSEVTLVITLGPKSQFPSSRKDKGGIKNLIK